MATRHCVCGVCKTCREALKAHVYWSRGEGAGDPPPKPPGVLTRGRLAETERFDAAEIRAVYDLVIAEGVQ